MLLNIIRDYEDCMPKVSGDLLGLLWRLIIYPQPG